MELRHLRYFAALGEEGSFARAARRLSITQPALSRQIMDLERELGFPLLVRLPRGVRLSEAGSTFHADASRILDEVAHMVERAKAVDRGEVGVLTIGFNESASVGGVMTRSLNEFRAARPDVALDLRPMTSVEQIAAVLRDELDGGFVYHFPRGGVDGVESYPIEVNDTVLAVATSHRLAGRPEIRLSDLAGEPMVWIRRTVAPLTYDRQMKACLEAGFSPRIVQEVTTESMVLSLVSTGVFIGLVTSAKRDSCPRGVCLLPISDVSLPFELSFIWCPKTNSAVVRGFVRVISRELEAEIA